MKKDVKIAIRGLQLGEEIEKDEIETRGKRAIDSLGRRQTLGRIIFNHSIKNNAKNIG